MNRGRLPYWRRIFVANIVASAMVLFAFSGASFRTPPRQLAMNFAVSLLFSSVIGPLLGILMPRVAPVIWERTRFPFNWIAISVVMIVLAMAGCVATIGLLVATGYVPANQFGNWLQGSLRISIVITLTIGLFITAYEVMRARVAQSSAEAKLAALESRVQPHFLFNTLNSIAALIHEDPKGAERMTGQLASLLRSSLDQQARPLVTLDEELRLVRDYLAIEQVRFGDRLRYGIAVDDRARAARVPRLALQTLVENSVKYAVSPRRGGATIAIRATCGDAQPPRVATTSIAIEDDGPGFDASALPAGHGLALLRDRVTLLYPKHASLTIESAPGRSVVTLTVPPLHDVPAAVAGPGGRTLTVPTTRPCAAPARTGD
jgi:two-component system sensor histidine kinase AlgZ